MSVRTSYVKAKSFEYSAKVMRQAARICCRQISELKHADPRDTQNFGIACNDILYCLQLGPTQGQQDFMLAVDVCVRTWWSVVE